MNSPTRMRVFTPARRRLTSGRSRRWSSDLFLQLRAGFAHLRSHQGAFLNLKKDALGVLAVASRGILHLLGHGECILSHDLALFDALDQLGAHRFYVFGRSFVFAD